MNADEHARHRLFLGLSAQLGDVEAATLMTHLPPMRWRTLAALAAARLV